jgi:multidrug resistance efflux pump
MTGTRRWRAIPWVLGVCLVAASLIGANRLLHQPESVGGGGAPPARNGGTPLKGGIVVLGTVDSDPSPSEIGPPAVAALSTVKKVLVGNGQPVKPGDPLVQFDDAQAQAKLDQAQSQLAAAELDVKRAEVAKKNHAIQLTRQQAAIQAAEEQNKLAEESLRIAKDKMEKLLVLPDITTGQPYTEAKKQRIREEDLDLRLLQSKVLELRAKADDARKQLSALELDPVDLAVAQAQIKVKVLKATVQEAQAAVDAYLVKAPKDVGGRVEQLRATEGKTYGPSTREPVLILVPAGKRIIRAEVQAEFAYKVAGSEGKKVTVYDDTNFALTYEGTVRRVASSFLPKRGADVALTVSPNKILEVEIDIADPAPAGKPELRVGQPVRVSFE